MLQKVLAARSDAGTALDLGCGSGLYSIFLARQGYRTTGLDFSQSAVEMARRHADTADVEVQFHRADVLAWDTHETFDLILDSRCLHGFDDAERLRYRENLLRWLAPNGDYVLEHFEKRHPLDWRPIGPRRIPARQTIALFEPELELMEHSSAIRAARFPVGPTVQLGAYWFRRRQ